LYENRSLSPHEGTSVIVQRNVCHGAREYLPVTV
jgi:hypothetical protein